MTRHVRPLAVPALVVCLLLPSLSPAQTYTWTGGGPNGNWSTASNWGGSPITSAPGTTLVLTGGANTTTTVDTGVPTSTGGGTTAALEIRALTFNAAASSFTVNQAAGAPAIRLMGGVSAAGEIFSASANNQTVNASVTTNATGGVLVRNTGTGLLTLNGPLFLGGAGFGFSATGNIDVTGVISSVPASNGVTYQGTGTVTLSGANTYGGLTLIGGTGTVKLAGGDNRLPTGTTVQFNQAGRIDLNGWNQQVARLTTFVEANARVVNTNSTAATFTVASTFTQSYAGTFGGPGGDNLNFRLAATAGTTFSLNAAHTYTGTTTVQSGTLSLFASGSLAGSSSIVVGLANGSGAIFDTVDLNGGLSYDAASAGFALASGQTLSGFSRVSGDTLVRGGAVIQGGVGTDVGTLTVSGVVRIQGGTAATGGTLRVAVRDNAGTVTNSSLAVAGLGNSLDLTGVATGTNRVRIDLRNAGGLQAGTSYTLTLATASAIRRNGTTVGGSYVFDAGDYELFSPDFASFSNVDLRTSSAGNQLLLTFTPVPEPAAVLGVAALGLAAVRSARRPGGRPQP